MSAMPFDLPAHEVLKLAGQTKVAWAVFQPGWYRNTYPDVRVELEGAPPDVVLEWYLQHGQQRGHSPNIFFDEAWHRRAYPAIAAAIRNGDVRSAFDSYCRGGHTTRSAHWLFDEPYYRKRYADLSDDVLRDAGLANGYDHYLHHGSTEKRIGHPLFDAQYYCANLEPEGATHARAVGPFLHYLRRIETRTPEPRTTLLFDPAWYLDRYPEVAAALAAGTWFCALQHYLCNDTPREFDPLPEFSEAFYLARNADLARQVAQGSLRNGYTHFLWYGAAELRAPSKDIDLHWYVTQDAVRAELEQGRAENAFAHWLEIGRERGLRATPPPEEHITEPQARTLFRRKADNLLPALARHRLDFTCADTPALSVVMVVRDGFAVTLLTLATLRDNFAGAIELILIDSGSADETRHAARHISGAQLLRFDSDIGIVRGRNAALNCVSTGAVLFLDGAVELAPGAVAAALRRLNSDPAIGAVGGKLIQPHGPLLEAGGIIWADAALRRYMHDASPLAPEANFVRDVDYCSAAFLLARTEMLRQLDGFDETCAPGYEDADLCRRIANAGRRVVYEPNAVAVHDGPGGAALLPSDAGPDQAQQVFRERHAAWLAQRPEASADARIFARSPDRGQHRVLLLEDSVPLRMLGSGFVRSNDLVQAMAALGHRLTVHPINPDRFDPAAVYADMPDTVEAMYDRGFDDLADFLRQRRGYYDTIWVARTHNLDRVRPLLELAASDERMPRVVLDTEAIAALRDAGRAALAGETGFDLEAAIRHEFANADCCARIVAVNAAEAGRLHDLGFGDVAVIGHRRVPQPTPRVFSRRSGLLFVGAMHRMDSPNYDSLCWLVDAVLPLVEKSLGWETRLTVVGYTAPDVTLDRFRDHPRVTLRGAVADTVPLYDSHRVFVAPTRFAAGTPYKVHEAASFGLPVVATELLRQQLDWEDGGELLAADCTDPARFAAHILALYRDEALWQRLRDAALARLERDNNPADFAAAIEAVLIEREQESKQEILTADERR
jgi:glycosyltransferase involved in cell wall biosynthesis